MGARVRRGHHAGGQPRPAPVLGGGLPRPRLRILAGEPRDGATLRIRCCAGAEWFRFLRVEGPGAHLVRRSARQSPRAGLGERRRAGRYPTPRATRSSAAVAEIAELVAFYNERVDISVDGVALGRPVSPFSDRAQRPS
ncbi:hypothetical protein E3O19_01145 [Cryobacterium algoritolerans]|uniref:Uncharacterized protein n=1 Tax=Cryobacterium algoritolerans TaxID=1259184 RepID=A0A4R8WWN0_9MICO|nr:hypothetical protein E3O19_01145 [Cryobacterium algoritolerans]